MRHDFNLAAHTYDTAAVLARETGRRMAERLDLVRLAPRAMADIGCATGDGIRQLQQRYPHAQAMAIDYAHAMLCQVRKRSPAGSRLNQFKRLIGRGETVPGLINADAHALPLVGNCLDLVWSNLMLHWLADPLPALREMQRTLRIGGLVMFTALGPDTLKELRQAAAKVGAGDTAAGVVRRFADMHDLGDMLQAAGFADPVMDIEMIRIDYRQPRRLLADLRATGVRDSMLAPLGWRHWRRIFAAWTALPEGFPASFEIIYGHAWKAAPKISAEGHPVIRLHPRRP